MRLIHDSLSPRQIFYAEDRSSRAEAFDRLTGRSTIISGHEWQRQIRNIGHDCYSHPDHASILFSFYSQGEEAVATERVTPDIKPSPGRGVCRSRAL
jgi:hypothetical protein